MEEYIIATDGGYSPARNIGACGIVVAKKDGTIIQKGSKKFVSKSGEPYDDITNQKMEVIAVCTGLASIKKPIKSLTVLTDSQYVIGNATLNWKRKKNIKLLAKMDSLIKQAQALCETPIEFKWCKGHNNDDSIETRLNNECDRLCQDSINSI